MQKQTNVMFFHKETRGFFVQVEPIFTSSVYPDCKKSHNSGIFIPSTTILGSAFWFPGWRTWLDKQPKLSDLKEILAVEAPAAHGVHIYGNRLGGGDDILLGVLEVGQLSSIKVHQARLRRRTDRSRFKIVWYTADGRRHEEKVSTYASQESSILSFERVGMAEHASTLRDGLQQQKEEDARLFDK